MGTTTPTAPAITVRIADSKGTQSCPAEVVALRKRQVKNFFALLMLSNGTPMFRMGDEFLQTQGGNNNPYNQDNETTWLDWRRLENASRYFPFLPRDDLFPQAHHSIARPHFWREDISWYGPERPVDMSGGSTPWRFACTEPLTTTTTCM